MRVLQDPMSSGTFVKLKKLQTEPFIRAGTMSLNWREKKKKKWQKTNSWFWTVKKKRWMTFFFFFFQSTSIIYFFDTNEHVYETGRACVVTVGPIMWGPGCGQEGFWEWCMAGCHCQGTPDWTVVNGAVTPLTVEKLISPQQLLEMKDSVLVQRSKEKMEASPSVEAQKRSIINNPPPILTLNHFLLLTSISTQRWQHNNVGKMVFYQDSLWWFLWPFCSDLTPQTSDKIHPSMI